MAITPQNSGIIFRQQINHWLSNFASADYTTQLTILTSGTLQLRKGMPVELQAIN